MKFFPTILDSLNNHAVETPDKVVYTWVDINCKEQGTMTFKQLEDQSNAVAARLLKLGCKKGDRVMVAYPFGLEFLAGMFGAMKTGVIPCSIYPPNPNQLKTDMPKFRGFVEDAGAKYALSSAAFATAMTAASVLFKTGVTWIGTDKLTIKKHKPNKPKDFETYKGEPEDVCFIQYTSGSTGRPKGVMISHRNLAENCMALVKMTDVTPSSVAALWVPQYHDMGLVAGFMSCLYDGFHLVLASPLEFVSRPLLWTDMIEHYQATHTCAPNFAYALLLKRLEQANRTSNWSCVKRAMFGGEPAQSHVVEAAAKTLSIKPEHVYNIYGLAESVVFLTGGSAYPDSEGLVCCGAVDSPTIKLRIVEDGKELENRQVGCIWAQSPRVAAGYYGKSELTTSTFANVLPGYDGTWLDTGDLGKIVDGQLYVTGRVKDVIIINGKNYYPTDVELSIDGLFGDAIRPGRTTAFQHGEDSVGITVESRKDFDKSANGDLAVQIANHVSQVHGLLVSDVLVLKLGVTPKTTSGKLKRNEVRLKTVGGDWKASEVLLRSQQQNMPSPNGSCFKKSSFLEHGFSTSGVTSSEFYLSEETRHEIRIRSAALPFGCVELPDIDFGQTNTLPSKAVEAVHAVECNPSKLDEYFSELHLDEIPGICEAWSKAVKTTEAMTTMCCQILKHLEDKQPTICQLAHTLSENSDWILIEDRTGFLFQLVHQVFVLQWVTTFMMNLPECMQQKLQNDAEWESTSQSILTVPVELQDVLGLPEKDPMHGTWPFFTWIKNRSVRTFLKLIQKALESPGEPAINTQVERFNNVLNINLLEAVWLEQRNGLYLVSQAIGRKIMSPNYYTKSILSKRALQVFGKFNLSWAQKIGNTHPPPKGEKGMKLNEEDWLSLFDQWGREKPKIQAINQSSGIKASLGSAAATTDDFSIRYANTITSVFGSSVDGSKTWAEHGLTSLRSAELRNKVEEELHVVLLANFVLIHDTPDLLEVFLIQTAGQRFPKSSAIDHDIYQWNLPRSRCTKLQLGLMQSFALVVLVVLVLVSAVPSFLFGAWAIEYGKPSNEEGNPSLGLSLCLLPLAFPLFLVTFSVLVVMCKLAIVGKYHPHKFELLTWDYLRWWFIDRLLHMWEVLVGKFVIATKFIWFFYWLLGAELAWSTTIDSFMREFDLIKIGQHSSLKHPLHCRRFHPAGCDAKSPSMSLQPIIIGKNCNISGMVSPGAMIGDGCKVEKLSFVEENVMVPDGVIARGIPAYNSGTYQQPKTVWWEECILGVFKMFLTLVEAYQFFILSFLVHGFLNEILPSWHYNALLHWFLLFPMASLLAMATSIILKWVLIGKRDPSEQYNRSVWHSVANWACYFHFKLASWPLFPFLGDSRLWNVIIFLHGLDVDMTSTLNINPYTIFVPSKVDFVKVQGSFVGTFSIDLESHVQGSQIIEIIGSSIGYNAHLTAGIKVVRSAIPPRSQLSDSVYDLNHAKGKDFVKKSVLIMVAQETAQVILNVLIFLSLVPAFELGLAVVTSPSMVVAGLGVVVAIFLQFFLWVLLSKSVYSVTFLDVTKPLLDFTFGVYLNHAWIFSSLNWLVILLFGTPMFGYYAQFMGAEVDGDLWYFGSSLYEYGCLHFKGTVIVDSAHVTGHYVDGNGLTIDDTFVTGLLHPGCYAPAGSLVSGVENGPWKVFQRIVDIDHADFTVESIDAAV
ncbi:unknown protein [Seminavis robusta]|uniref:AMP-dependent synthetase/ligase domain-containing protein n=1 Tax=Seminavis robusta TaxID=568900 RepID=A0A9N8EMT0_9STRA|nr:unknown protein [Seminavis robusta]|eukprot:Sro1385_g268210.1 n/a (1688) ;mRNA; r:18262-23734